jgi:hypothetical protein
MLELFERWSNELTERVSKMDDAAFCGSSCSMRFITAASSRPMGAKVPIPASVQTSVRSWAWRLVPLELTAVRLVNITLQLRFRRLGLPSSAPAGA